MKNVVLFANSTWCIYNFRFNLMKKLVQQGCRVHVLAPLDPTYDNEFFLREFKKLGVSFHEVPLEPRGLNPIREVHSILTIFRILWSLKPHAVLSYTVKCNLYAGFCRQILGFKQIANVPGLGEVFEKKNLLCFLVSCLYRLSFHGMSKAFFQNQEDLAYCLKRKLVPARNCFILPGSGVDLSRFQPACPPRHSLALPGGKRVFLMFGRVLPQKGYSDYLQAAAQLKAEFGDQVECWVMGIEDKNRPDSTSLFQSLREAESRGLIKLLPTSVDVVPTLTEVDVVVLPSRYNEGIPRSLLEAMAMGKVIITTNWRGCRETVENGKNGYLVPVDEETSLIQDGALTQAMKKVAEMDDLSIRAMGRHSRRLVEERYDEQLVLRHYLLATLDQPTLGSQTNEMQHTAEMSPAEETASESLVCNSPVARERLENDPSNQRANHAANREHGESNRSTPATANAQ